MDTIFMNRKSSITSDCRRLKLNLSRKMYLKRGDKCAHLSNVSMYYTWKNMKK